MADFVLKNFRIALVILSLACLIKIGYSINHVSELRAISPFAYRGIYSSCILLLSTFLGWAIYYRNQEGAWLALVVGICLLVSDLGLVISSYANDFSFNKMLFGLLFYLGISHVGYALLFWQEVLEELGKGRRL